MSKTVETTIERIGEHVGQEVTIKGWLYNARSSGKISFLQVRDGTGFIQAVFVQSEAGEETFELANALGQESAITVTGTVKEDARAPSGFELSATGLEQISSSEEYPITLKEHGVDFLLQHRHLWLRTPKQQAIMRIRSTLLKAASDFLADRGFTRLDAPILTPVSVEGTSDLFETDYFDDQAYLTQSGQLYAEAGAMALGKVYTMGPTFRAEKSKTRRHLTEFWMIEPEAAYYTHEDNLVLQENFVSAIAREVLEKNSRELAVLERDTAPLEKITPPFPRISYDDAVDLLHADGFEFEWGDDFGAPHEEAIAAQFDKPVFVDRFPAQIKAFYMQPDPERPEVVLAADLLAPEGYGELIGGSQRIDDYELLLKRLHDYDLPQEPFEWYLDLRRYGSVPHSGFGMGVERAVAWLTGAQHVRECIAFPRMLNRIYP